MGQIYLGDVLEVLKTLPDKSVHMCVTSPPYWGLRDYGIDGQIGLEKTPEEYVQKLVEVFREVWRVLRDDGTLWLNLGDSYVGTGHKGNYKDPKNRMGRNGQKIAVNNKVDGLKPKDLVGIPWRVAFALQADGWYLRSDIIWHKGNAMPESVKDRPTKAHEYIFLLSKSPKYYYDAEAIREPNQTKYTESWGDFKRKKDYKRGGGSGAIMQKDDFDKYRKNGRNKRTVWNVNTKPFKGAHFAVFPPDLIKPCILAGSPEKACPHCGAPWERIVEVLGESAHQKMKRLGYSPKRGQDEKARQSLDYAGGHGNNIRERITKGWKPTCNCENNDGSGKGIVLDPFFGSGTTGLVAQELGRDWIGIEINPEYVKLAEQRIYGAKERLTG